MGDDAGQHFIWEDREFIGIDGPERVGGLKTIGGSRQFIWDHRLQSFRSLQMIWKTREIIGTEGAGILWDSRKTLRGLLDLDIASRRGEWRRCKACLARSVSLPRGPRRNPHLRLPRREVEE